MSSKELRDKLDPSCQCTKYEDSRISLVKGLATWCVAKRMQERCSREGVKGRQESRGERRETK